MAVPCKLMSYLELNKFIEKKQVAVIKKILCHHCHFDMKPFFDWDMKLLPTVAVTGQFDRALDCDDIDEADVISRKASTIYQFIHTMPEGFGLSSQPSSKSIAQSPETCLSES